MERWTESWCRIRSLKQQSGNNVYQFLLYFDKLYDKFTDAEKKTFLSSFIEQVDIFEEEQPDVLCILTERRYRRLVGTAVIGFLQGINEVIKSV